MSSSPPPSPGRPWSLRARLLAGQIAVLVIACLGIGAVTAFALHQYLVTQLDKQLSDAVHRSSRLHGEPPPPSWRHRHQPRPGPGPDFLDAPGQPVGMIAAVVRDGTLVNAAYLDSTGTRTELSADAVAELAADAGGHRPATVRLDGVGRYRVAAGRARHGDDVVVVGLPLAAVDATVLRVLLIFAVVILFAVAAATTAGILVIRRALAPLGRVAQTAAEVVDLPLDRGEVTLPVRVGPADADSHTEVGRLGLAVNRMLDHIAAALSTRQASETRVRRFVADASHELRTPLTAIRGYAELAQRIPDDPDAVTHALSRVISESERMTALVEDLLLLARLDSGRALEHETVDLSALVIDAVSDAHVAGPDHQWRLDLPDEPVLVAGDAARLQQVLTNLLANARTHTGPGTVVTAGLTVDGPEVVLRVTDDGPGIPEPLQREIFQRFARGDSSRSRKAGSTGLGLAIAAAVVKAHGGSIAVDSRPGHTEFSVRLPASP
ncbi:HAMP domain-containing histidine kinase [Mycobacterium sp. M1]|uniref:histidine kinase n=1 Tax=Mycolicibacter acidiphilus TaxID=2835306 RepID=A0ABS5RN82_9MYCO|nr:HAMP domain-containing sensor histidine kinase [Mycolicibacter acidiphilus]MBS9535773.1 HAMP domain-containing histidine kinase [Mycolicibacter acidiphilus]